MKTAKKYHRCICSARALVAFALALAAAMPGCSGGGGSAPAVTPIADPTPPTPVIGPAWLGFGGDAQHSAIGGIATQPITRIVWRTPVDLAPQYRGTALLIHYGSPVISARNTVLVPVKTTAAGGFRVEARAGASGAQIWSAATDYVLPAGNFWTPSYNLTRTTSNRVYAPGAGGKLFFRDNVDSATGSLQTAVFFGAANYAAATAAFDASVFINTPLTSDAAGNVFFGFIATGTNPAGLVSGIARVSADGTGTWTGAAAASGVSGIEKVAMNSAPALSMDSRTLYVAVSGGAASGRASGYLLALDSATLATRSKIFLADPATAAPAWLNESSTSSPMVGSDGDVYFGVLESNAPAHNFRGWLLHFDAALTRTKTPGSFGWDDTPSMVPASMVPGYSGGSAYLLMSKYNNYGGIGSGDGKNRIAILDPNQSQVDSISGDAVMKEILTILGPTPDPGYPGGVTEWCINTAAVDPATRSVLANSEDGYLYRWDLATNRLSERIQLTSGLAESYTPTAIGPDGAVYAINNAVLFSVGR